jgi:NADH dehydrogenase (ubiquinone) 1 alpha subcomplex subunit 13
MPPTGGFESLKYKRNLPYKGPGAYVLLGGVTAICAYGFYRLGKGNLERRYVVSSYCLRAGLL